MKFFNDISGKALLYAVPLFLAPFVDKLGTGLFNGTWPTLPVVVGCILLGTVQTSIGLRAFFDGSYERRKSGSDAGDLRVKQPTPPNNPTPSGSGGQVLQNGQVPSNGK